MTRGTIEVEYTVRCATCPRIAARVRLDNPIYEQWEDVEDILEVTV